jgi:hypothetical protein
VRDVRHRLGDERRVLGDERRARHRVLARERADDEPLGRDADRVEAAQAVDVDHRGRRGQPHVERGDQALTAREEPALGSIAIEEIEGLVERGRPVVRERRGLHSGALYPDG